jgi:protein-S-isoprenylcysteine O-methyltransferase Ste14
MGIQTILLVTAGSLWGLLELALILRDAARGAGGTAADKGTRRFNFLAMTLSPTAAAIVTAVPGARLLGIANAAVCWIGLALMALGLGLRVWAVAVLGASFRTTIELHEGQRVIQGGPYRFIRHPSYAGLLLMCVGLGLALRNAVSLVVALVPPVIALVHRIGLEEAAMAAEMGPEYAAYRERTWRLVPGLW